MNSRPTHEERMIVAYSGYIGAMAWKAFRKFGHVYRMDLEDFRQEAVLALLLALCKVDWNSFSSREIDHYLRGKIRARMVDFIRSLDMARDARWRGKEREWVSVSLMGNLEDMWIGSYEYPMVEMLALAEGINRAHCSRDRRILVMAAQGYHNTEIADEVKDNLRGGVKVCPSRIAQVISASGLFRYKGEGRHKKRQK